MHPCYGDLLVRKKKRGNRLLVSCSNFKYENYNILSQMQLFNSALMKCNNVTAQET